MLLGFLFVGLLGLNGFSHDDGYQYVSRSFWRLTLLPLAEYGSVAYVRKGQDSKARDPFRAWEGCIRSSTQRAVVPARRNSSNL